MKKIILILSILFLFGCSQKEKEAALITNININKYSLEYYEKVNLYDLINIENGTIIDKDYQINTKELGEKEITVNYKDSSDKESTYKFTISINDTTSPLGVAYDNTSTQ